MEPRLAEGDKVSESRHAIQGHCVRFRIVAVPFENAWDRARMTKFYRAAPAERTITLSIRLDCDSNVVGHVIGSNFAHTSANPAIALDVLQSVVRAYLSLMIGGSARASSPAASGSPTSGVRFIFKEEGQ